VGDDPDHRKAKSDVRVIWEDVRSVWFSTGAPARNCTTMLGRPPPAWLEAKHGPFRASALDFPHSAHYDGSLADVAFPPTQTSGS